MLDTTQRLLPVLALVVIAGCAKLPTYQRPEAELPASWKALPTAGQAVPADRWWTVYADPRLNELVEEGLIRNRNLAIAAARIDEARAQLRIADSLRSPGVDATAERTRTRVSERSAGIPPGVPVVRNNNRVQINIGYELDFWGRLAGASAAARAELLATEAARQTIRLALTDQIVQSYYALLALDRQIAVTERTLDLRQRDLGLQRKRYEAGLIADFSLRQLEAEVSAARAQLPTLQQRRTAQEVALLTLVGRTPRGIVEDDIVIAPDKDATIAAVVPEGLPSDLLLRRPDVLEAEQRLIAANARIGVARASLFPRIALTGYAGSESTSLGDLFSAPALIWQLAAGLTQPIFQGGRLRAELDAAEAQQRQAVEFYQRTLQTAFGEVRQALSAQTRAREAFAAETDRAGALSETLRLARIRYENGLSSQLEVLDAERNLLQAELNRIDALRAQRTAVADLVRALGGGWSSTAAPTSAVPSAR